jgi:transaldolase/glucose-6-phosphate isomerase
MSNPPVDIQKHGQSIWYDNISRDLLENGEIKRLVEEDGVMGITSNPTIFENAVTSSDIYDATIEKHLEEDANDIYEALAIEDILTGAAVLYPVYQRTDGVDGYISLEVSPLLADDTETTLSEARRLFQTLDRENIMIKIPATEAGLPAIEEAIYDGINVNVTLIFSVDRYAEVIEAYLRGLERRLDEGKDVDVASVASFFLSRIDSKVDAILEEKIRIAEEHNSERVAAYRELLGQAAIASAKLAYRHFKQIFEGERFERLRQAGARVQRPLWASTSTKNPAYPDTLYVDNLIAPHTVNTMPPKTLKAFKDHGTISTMLEDTLDECDEVMDKLAEAGVNMESVTYELQVEGVEKFAKSFHHLMDAIEGKRRVLQMGLIERQQLALGEFELAIREQISAMEDAPARIWNKDAAWWKEEPFHQDVIYNRLGWLTILENEDIDRQRLTALQQEVANQDWQHAILLGMGGSSLAAEVMSQTFGKQPNHPAFIVLDTTVPAAIQAVEQQIDPAKTVFIVASKSGGTVETLSLFEYFYEKVQAVQGDKASEQFIIITDPGSSLVETAHQRKIERIFENPSDIGGRYSALSYFGMVPAAIMGIDLAHLFGNAELMREAIDRTVPAQGNPAMWLGVTMAHLARSGIDKVSIISSPSLDSFGAWTEQLLAESTGKEGIGLIPVVGDVVSSIHDYDDDRFFVYVRLDDEGPERDAEVQKLIESGYPVFTIELPDVYALGGEFLRWEFATAVAGQMLGVNPFDEPNVTEAKRNTQTLLESHIQQQAFPNGAEPLLSEDNVSLYADKRMRKILGRVTEQRKLAADTLTGLLAAHVGLARSGHYVAVLAYTGFSPQIDSLLNEARHHLRHVTQRAVTLGYGPRYLHSTGQLHKGGPDTGVFLLITTDDDELLPIPERRYSFSVLKRAQALGDYQTLSDRERRVLRLHISGDIQAGLAHLVETVKSIKEKLV